MSRVSQKNGLKSGLFILLVISLLMPQTFAQEQTGKGRISGTVADEKGQPIDGAMILVESVKTDTRFQGVSDKSGHFAVAGMGTGYCFREQT